MTENEAADRDNRVGRRLQREIKWLTAEIQRHEEEIRYLKSLQDHVVDAVTHGTWWNLKGLVDDTDIDSLCDLEPVPRTRLLTEDCE